MSAIRAAALLVALLTTLSPPIAHGQAALTATQLTERLDEWDQAYARLKRETWNLQRGSPMFGRDLRGRTLSDDLRDFVLTQATEKRFVEQRNLLTTQIAKGDIQLATETLVGLYGNLRDEIEGLDRIGDHRVRYRQLARQRAFWQQRVSTLPNYQPPSAIRDLEQRAVEQLNAGRFEQTRATYSELLQAYSNERERLRQSGVKLGRTSSEEIVYERRSPCGSAAKVTPNKAIPSLSSNTHPDYPAAAKTDGQEGTVYVQLLVSGGGCALRYGIQLSSGWLDLDQASLEWIETLEFIPAAKDGKAIEAWVTLPVVFRLN